MHHYAFRNRILAAHPQLRRLYGAEPRQLLMVVLLLTARWGLAWALADAPLLLIGALACTVGCWLVHGLGTYAHEQAHRLIVAREPAASAVDLLIECGMTSFGKMVAYQYRHVNFHHRYLGDYEWDSEVRDLCAHVVVVEAADRAALASRALGCARSAAAAASPPAASSRRTSPRRSAASSCPTSRRATPRASSGSRCLRMWSGRPTGSPRRRSDATC